MLDAVTYAITAYPIGAMAFATVVALTALSYTYKAFIILIRYKDKHHK